MRLDTTYNPMDVAYGRTAKVGMPYVSSSKIMPSRGPEIMPRPPADTGVVRATGTGPFDAAYRQNLAVQAGGQWARPGGSMEFNPTGPLNFGTPSGGGNAPTFGLPPTLLSIMGPQPGTVGPAPAAPAPQAPPQRPAPTEDQIRWWLAGMGFH